MARSVGTALYVLLSVATVGANGDPKPPVWPGRFHAMMSQVKDGDYGVVDLWYDYDAGRNLNIIQTQGMEEDGPLFDNERANGTTYYYHPAKAKSKYCNVVDFGVGLIKPDWLKGATYLGEEECGIYKCYKWEQGEIPEAHARFLGLRGGVDSFHAYSGGKKTTAQQDQDEEYPRNVARLDPPSLVEDVFTAAAEGLSLRGSGSGSGSVSDGEGESGVVEEGGRGDRDRFITYWSEKGTGRPVRWVFFNDAYFEVIRFDEGATMPDHAFQIPGYCFEEGG